MPLVRRADSAAALKRRGRVPSLRPALLHCHLAVDQRREPATVDDPVDASGRRHAAKEAAPSPIPRLLTVRRLVGGGSGEFVPVLETDRVCSGRSSTRCRLRAVPTASVFAPPPRGPVRGRRSVQIPCSTYSSSGSPHADVDRRRHCWSTTSAQLRPQPDDRLKTAPHRLSSSSSGGSHDGSRRRRGSGFVRKLHGRSTGGSETHQKERG
jgi:hypothetical protein